MESQCGSLRTGNLVESQCGSLRTGNLVESQCGSLRTGNLVESQCGSPTTMYRTGDFEVHESLRLLGRNHLHNSFVCNLRSPSTSVSALQCRDK